LPLSLTAITFAAFMNMTIGLTLGLLYGNATKQDKRLLLIIAFVLMGIALMFTGSRGRNSEPFRCRIAFVILANLFRRKTEREANGEEGKAIFQGNLLFDRERIGAVFVC
jgi:hypothetical protein